MINSELRTKCAEKLLRTISLKRMHNSLLDLFVDRTKNNEPINLFGDEESMKQAMRYNNCNRMNDERYVAFCNTFKQENYVFDERKQIWIEDYIDTEKDDLFIPRDDAND